MLAMAETRVVRTLDVTPEALWQCVRAFDDTPWVPGPPPEIRGEGIGLVRIFERPEGAIHERLTSLDDAARTLCYEIPIGIPFPVTAYAAKMAVSDDGGRGRITWSCTFDPERGASADEVAKGISGAYEFMIGRIEAHLKQG
jgi:polyketide cyclase/dehydrase/lipid transport protein